MAGAPGRIRWRCRRGIRELDLLLEGWLDRAWAGAGAGTREDFERLLETPDPELAGWLLGGGQPRDEALAALVHDILHRRP